MIVFTAHKKGVFSHRYLSGSFTYLLLHVTASTLDTRSEFGAVRLLTSGCIPTVGRVSEFCDGSHWGRVCYDTLDNNDAAVVCRELGYTAPMVSLH